MNNKFTVLVAEDEPINQILLRDRLKDEGFHVILAKNENEILEYGLQADLLVVDVRLVEIEYPITTDHTEGIDAVSRLITERGLSSKVPIIFVSIYEETYELYARKLNERPELQQRYRWLQKPFELDLLIDAISKALKISAS
jgi:two-component system, NarL family, capsular synthesis sensor histidine kinase RcsC